MSNGKRVTGLFGGAGVLVAVLIISAFVAGSNIIQAQAKGTLTIQIMDKPVELTNLDLTIDWVRIQDNSGGWINLTLETPEPFDLLALQDHAMTLSETDIAPGNYSMISIHVSTATATYQDGNTEDLQVPSEVIKVLLQPHVNLESGGKVAVLIDLQPDQSSIAISKSLNLRPVIKAVVG